MQKFTFEFENKQLFLFVLCPNFGQPETSRIGILSIECFEREYGTFETDILFFDSD